MKKLYKIMLLSGVTMMLGTGAVLSYLQAQQPLTSQEELTLANIEALAASPENDKIMCLGSSGFCVYVEACDALLPGYNVYNGGLLEIF